MADVTEPQPPVRFQTHPSRYAHLRLTVDGSRARLGLDIQEDKPLRPGYTLKQNSYDLGVDIELADAISRLRFEHPEVRSLVISSDQPKIFCAGANIYMLGSSTHGFKVNFCKFTNETRLTLEEAATESGIHSIAALNGVAAGGGYELALACEHIVLQDDGNSAVSFPETPLLAVLPGTGGLTRLVDKRKVRRDLADVFSTLAEGVRGKRAKDWGLVDEVVPRSKFDEAIQARAQAFASQAPLAGPSRQGPGVALPEIAPARTAEGAVATSTYKYVTLSVDTDSRVAQLVVNGPSQADPDNAAAYQEVGAEVWHLRAFRELDDALLDLRFNHPTIGLVCLYAKGCPQLVKQADETLLALQATSWFAREVLLFVRRTTKRLDLTAKSLFAIAEQGSCFVGSLLELALASDRIFVYAGDEPAALSLSGINFGSLPMATGNSRLVTRFLGTPEKVGELQQALASGEGRFEGEGALEAGLATFAPDDIDWEDEVRIAVEERASLSPDALTGMEANLRFCGPETMETKIFARLSAWQNWIFQRPNAVGERGALTMYGAPERPEFDWRRT